MVAALCGGRYWVEEITMSTLKNLAFYNPSILKDEDFLASFVARREHANRLLSRLKEIKPGGLATHYLILGQRGMGKTSLLRWLALGIRDDKELSGRFIPLTFREEQYNVNSLHVLWLNCLDALGDWFEKNGFPDKAAALDKKISQLLKDDPVKDRDGLAALELFLSSCKSEGKQPLLLLDNLDLILSGIGKEQDWSFRRELQKPGGIVVIGASVAYLEANSDSKAAFYDFFQIILLEPLTRNELLSCLEYLAKQRGEAGKNVLKILSQESSRIHTLYDLTGGNPRTLALLCALLELNTADDVMGDLEHLLDQVTVLYKARVEDQAPQARVVLDALALNWDPSTAADLAKTTALETSAVSAQLDRLQKNGIIEKVSISTSVRTAYQVSERFFNIWYLMRHAPRRTRNRLRWLTEFLSLFYAPSQLETHARDLLDRQQCNGEYLLALGDAVNDDGLRCELYSQGCKKLGLNEEEWKIPMLKETNDQNHRVNDLMLTATNYCKEKKYIEAERIFRQAINIDSKNCKPWIGLGILFHYSASYSEAENAYRKAIELAPRYSMSWQALGLLLQDNKRYAEAEQTYRMAIELTPKSAHLWKSIGNVLEDLDRYTEAEEAYRKALEIEPKNAELWNKLGYLFNNLERFQEAETTLRKAVELDPENAGIWNDLGNMLNTLGRFSESEEAYRKSIELNPNDTRAWESLGNLFHDCLARFTDAEKAYSKALELDPELICVAGNLAYLLFRQQRNEEAEPYYQQAIAGLPPHGVALLSACRSIAFDNFGEAVKAFGQALDTNSPELFSNFHDDLLRVLEFFKAKGYGDRLLKWMDDGGYRDRFWPVYVAFDAYMHGEERLKDVNPEVRTAAKRIYEKLAIARSAQIQH